MTQAIQANPVPTELPKSSHVPDSARHIIARYFSKKMRAEQQSDHYRFLLLFKFGLVNLASLGLLTAAYLNGWVQDAIVADFTGLTFVICAVALIGFTICARRIVQLSMELNQVRHTAPDKTTRVQAYLLAVQSAESGSRPLLANALRMKLAGKINVVKHFANVLVFLGLVGTVLGFIIALSGVDPETASDVSAVGPMVATLIDGMAVALYTTLIGSILHIWLMINFRLLETATTHFYTALIEKGVEHA